MFRLLISGTTLLLAATSSFAAADPLDEALIEKAGGILDALHRKKFKNVGVVKFLIRKGEGEPQDDVGDLNLSLANKLEVALILANIDEKFGIIDKASAAIVREKLLMANHLTEAGRKAFFARKYELAWSRDKVDASGFLTGIATLSPDLTKITLKFQVFDTSGKIEDLPGSVSVATNPELLAQAGFSYALALTRQTALIAGDPLPPSGTIKREIVEQVAKRAAPPPKKAEVPHSPLADCPIKWDVLYNGKPVTITGSAVPEPQSSDQVAFTLTNPKTGTYAIVLIVNGENTLYQERVAPAVCRKWVLGPQSSVSIRGFQTAADTVAPFAVLRPEEPMPDAVRYGDHSGTFRLVVFHGKMTDTNPAENRVKLKPEDASTLALSRTRGGTRQQGVKPQTLKALQADLRGRIGTDGARGYVVKSGATEKFETRSVYFVPSPELPVADISLRYFTPKK